MSDSKKWILGDVMCVEVFRKTQATLWRRPERAAPRSEAEPGLAPGLPCPARRRGRAGGRVCCWLFFSLIQRPPAIKTGSLDCPRHALVSCIRLCWFPGMPLLLSEVSEVEDRVERMGQVLLLVFCSLSKCLHMSRVTVLWGRKPIPPFKSALF